MLRVWRDWSGRKGGIFNRGALFEFNSPPPFDSFISLPPPPSFSRSSRVLHAAAGPHRHRPCPPCCFVVYWVLRCACACLFLRAYGQIHLSLLFGDRISTLSRAQARFLISLHLFLFHRWQPVSLSSALAAHHFYLSVLQKKKKICVRC